MSNLQRINQAFRRALAHSVAAVSDRLFSGRRASHGAAQAGVTFRSYPLTPAMFPNFWACGQCRLRASFLWTDGCLVRLGWALRAPERRSAVISLYMTPHIPSDTGLVFATAKSGADAPHHLILGRSFDV